MTDPRTDALTAPTTDPGIVHALVYIGDQIAATSHQSDKNRPRNDQEGEREPKDTPSHKRPAKDVLAFLEKEGAK